VPNKTDNLSKGDMLFPHYCKWTGRILVILGSSLAYLRFGLNISPDFFECKVFAIYSAYFKTSWFSVIDNNIMEELCGVIIMTGLFMIAFTKEKVEKPQYREIRFKALKLSLILSSGITIFSFLFIYGTAFLAAIVLNIFLPLAIYNLLFYYMLCRYKSNEKII
jgi:hypothetical protein